MNLKIQIKTEVLRSFLGALINRRNVIYWRKQEQKLRDSNGMEYDPLEFDLTFDFDF